MANLLLQSGSEQGRSLPLHKDRIVLGRVAECDIIIKETMIRRETALDTNSVSRKHAVISCVGGAYYIEDGDGQGHKSRNGTFVNDQLAPFPGRIRLRNDDRIRICNFVCTFHEEPVDSFSVEESIDHESSSHSLEAQPADKLRILLEITNSLSRTLETDALLPRIIDQLFQLFQDADRGFIVLQDEASGALVSRVSKTRRAGDEPNAHFSVSIVRRCLDNREAILANDLARQFPDSESIIALPIRSLMCAPLWSQDGQLLGAIQLDLGGPTKKFSREDLNLLVGVANQAAIALSNARLYRDSLINQRRARDLEMAHQVQRALLPQHLPDVSGYEFFAYSESAQEIGGDHYDFIPLPQQRLAVLLGDVSGKGVAAALVMVKFSVEARVCFLSEPDPAAAVSKLNTLINRAKLPDRYVTLIAAVLNPATHTTTLVNAGHPPPLLFRHATMSVEEAAPVEFTRLPIGIADGHDYVCCQVELQPGDRILLFSDGVTEAMNPQGRQFGTKGVRAVLEGENPSPRESGERLIRAVKQHASGSSQNDDITLVCFGRTRN